MIRAYFERDARGELTAFHCEGHSGYAEASRDIVCSAVSALMQAAVFSLQMLYQPVPQCTMANGVLHCILPRYSEPTRSEVQAILRHTLLGVMNIALGQPKHLQVQIEGIGGIDVWRQAFKEDDIPLALQNLLKSNHHGTYPENSLG